VVARPVGEDQEKKRPAGEGKVKKWPAAKGGVEEATGQHAKEGGVR